MSKYLSDTDYMFDFNGGISKPSYNSTTKFFLFLLYNGEEISSYHALKSGLLREMTVQTSSRGKLKRYKTRLKYGKIFISSSVVFGARNKITGVPVFSTHLYFRFLDNQRQEVTVTDYPVEQLPFTTGMFSFKGYITFMKKKEVKDLLYKGSASYKFLCDNKILPIKTLKKMINIDRTVARKNVRYVRLK